MVEKQLLETFDKSPSYEVRFPSGAKETMHNKKGALSESLYIYHRAIIAAQKLRLPSRYLSIGLGLGYNEMILAAEDPEFECCLSFEKDPDLRDKFQNWLSSSSQQPYDTISKLIAHHFHIPPHKIKKILNRKKKFQLKSELKRSTRFSNSFSCVFYDPFCSKNQPELWEQGFLENLIDKAASQKCVWSSYSACSNLKKALQAKGFQWVLKKGFQGKREACLAIRS